MAGIGIRDFKLLRCSRTSSREEEENSLDSLPSHIVVEEILARIPAQVIWASARRVCKTWSRMTHDKKFIFANLHHSTPGLLFRNLMKNIMYFMCFTEAGQIAISRLKYKFTHNIWSSCNGLVLEYKLGGLIHLRITNPVTNQHFLLPPFNLSIKLYTRSAIAYVANHTEYKVVHTYNSGDQQESRKHNACAILTVGVDTCWRLVDIHHLSLATREQFGTTPFVTGGFVHWANNDGGINESAIFERKDGNNIPSHDQYHTINRYSYYVLTLNVETEKITLYPAPPCNGKYYFKYLNSGGGDLSLLIGSGYLKWDVWEMKPDTGEWTKLPCSIDLEARKDLLNNQLYDLNERGEGGDINLFPGGWLKYREVIIFNAHLPVENNKFLLSRLRVVYNLQTQDITLFALDYNFHSYAVHCHSLIEC